MDGSVSCGDETIAGVDFNSDGDIRADNPCVPVNLFTDALLGQRAGQFTPAEAAFLFDTRNFGTTYTQGIVNGIVTGTLANLPAGALQAVAGFELRTDEIESNPDEVALGGFFAGFSTDAGTNASKDVSEVFGELVIPVAANQPLFRELNFELAGRITDDEFYGTNDTYSAKFGWRPVDSLLLRGTYGTSFRAPTLAENFLAPQTAFPLLGDPCVVPEVAIVTEIGGNRVYDANLDPRDQVVLDNCTREGVDPLTLGLDTANNNQILTTGTYQTTATRGGSLGLDPETSRSFSYGFSFEQPWFESFDLALSLTYYDIEITDSIIRPGVGFIVADCYLRDDGVRSRNCDAIERGVLDALSPPVDGLITNVSQEFINRDEETATGFDVNVAFSKDLTIFGEPVDLRIDLRGNKLEERTTNQLDDEGNPDFQTFVGQFGFPEYRVVNTINVDYQDYRLTWRTNYLSSVTQDPDFVDPFDNFVDGSQGETCLGEARGDVDCRDFAEADDYFNHSVSLYYRGDSWVIGGGIRNVFDQQPPVVDSSEVGAVLNNTPLGSGYDLQGRTLFFNVAKSF